MVDNKFINAIHVEDVAKIIQEQVNLLNKSQIINGVVQVQNDILTFPNMLWIMIQ